MKTTDLLIGLAIMAGVTYFCRVISFILFRKEIKNRFIQSMLYYLPYSVLAIMVFPKIIFSTPHLVSGLIGTAVAVLLGLFKRSLLTVALASVVTVFIVEQLIPLF